MAGDETASSPRAWLVLSGIVVRGDKRGRELGFPTANVHLDAASPPLPGDGIYAGWFEGADGRRHLAAISVGSRPTYYGEHGSRLVEAHLLDFCGDLYGQGVRLGIGAKVRGQERFSSSEELIEQMHRDVEEIRQLAAPR